MASPHHIERTYHRRYIRKIIKCTICPYQENGKVRVLFLEREQDLEATTIQQNRNHPSSQLFNPKCPICLAPTLISCQMFLRNEEWVNTNKDVILIQAIPPPPPLFSMLDDLCPPPHHTSAARQRQRQLPPQPIWPPNHPPQPIWPPHRIPAAMQRQQEAHHSSSTSSRSRIPPQQQNDQQHNSPLMQALLDAAAAAIEEAPQDLTTGVRRSTGPIPSPPLLIPHSPVESPPQSPHQQQLYVSTFTPTQAATATTRNSSSSSTRQITDNL